MGRANKLNKLAHRFIAGAEAFAFGAGAKARGGLKAVSREMHKLDSAERSDAGSDLGDKSEWPDDESFLSYFESEKRRSSLGDPDDLDDASQYSSAPVWPDEERDSKAKRDFGTAASKRGSVISGVSHVSSGGL